MTDPVHTVKLTVVKIFVAFSENVNFKRLKISTDLSKALESKIVSKVRLVELLPKARILLLMKLTRNQKFEPAKNTVENVVQIGPKKRPT